MLKKIGKKRHEEASVCLKLLRIFIILTGLSSSAFGWTFSVHKNMTKVALERLPQEQLELISPFRDGLENIFCVIPDLERTDPVYRPFIDSFLAEYDFSELPESPRLLLHSGDMEEYNERVYIFYTKKILEEMTAGNVEIAIKYLGTFLHFLQDSSCPGHFRYGGQDRPRGEGFQDRFSSLEFFKRFMPVPEEFREIRLHGLVDKPGFSEQQLRDHIGEYQPVMLGENLVEIIEQLKNRHGQAMIGSDQMLCPMLQALFEGDGNRLAEHGLTAVCESVRLSADYIYSIFQKELMGGTTRLSFMVNSDVSSTDLSELENVLILNSGFEEPKLTSIHHYVGISGGAPGDRWMINPDLPNTGAMIIQRGFESTAAGFPLPDRIEGEQFAVLTARKNSKSDFGKPTVMSQQVMGGRKQRVLAAGETLILTVDLADVGKNRKPPVNFCFGLYEDKDLKHVLAERASNSNPSIVLSRTRFKEFSLRWTAGVKDAGKPVYIGFKAEDYEANPNAPRLGIDNVQLRIQ